MHLTLEFTILQIKYVWLTGHPQAIIKKSIETLNATNASNIKSYKHVKVKKITNVQSLLSIIHTESLDLYNQSVKRKS